MTRPRPLHDRLPGVLMVTGAYFPELSGGGLQARSIVRALRQDVLFLVLTTCSDPTLSREGRVDDVDVSRIFVDVRRVASKLSAAIRLAIRMMAWRNRIDVIHLHGFSQKSMLIVVLGRLLKKKILMTIHTAGLEEPDGVRALGRLAYWCYSQADLFLTISPRLKASLLAAGVPDVRIWPVSNGVDLKRFSPIGPAERATLRARLGLPEPMNWILFVGFFSRDKAPDVLFDAWLRLQAEYQRTGLVFVGATHSRYFEVDASIARSIRDRADRAAVSDRVRFVEPTADVEDYYRAADVFAMPSIREGFGMALVEAMACELPVVASRLDGVTDTIVEHGHDGLLVPPQDVGALALALRSLLEDRERAATLAANARASVGRRFGLDVVAQRWYGAYERVLGTAGTR